MIVKGYIITKSSANTQWLLQRWNIVSIVTITLFHHNKTLRLLYLIKWILLFGVDSPTFQSFLFHFQLPSVFPVMTLPMQLLFSELQQHLTAVCSSSVPPSQPSSPPLCSIYRLHLQRACSVQFPDALQWWSDRYRQSWRQIEVVGLMPAVAVRGDSDHKRCSEKSEAAASCIWKHRNGFKE